MAKIRGFKPDLWTDEDFVDLTPFARLLWMGLWSYACDNGHLADKSKQIKMRVLPTDEVNCAELLRELEQNGRIRRADGVITIPNFTKHQKPDKRYFQTCEVPGCTRPGADPQRETRGGHDEPTAGTRGGHGVASWGPHVDGEVMVKDGDGDSSAAGATPRKRGHQLPKGWQPNDRHAALAAERSINLAFEVEKFRDWAVSKGEAKKDWDATFRNWLRNAKPTPGASRPARNLPHANQLELPPDGLTPEEYAAWERAQREKRRGA